MEPLCSDQETPAHGTVHDTGQSAPSVAVAPDVLTAAGTGSNHDGPKSTDKTPEGASERALEAPEAASVDMSDSHGASPQEKTGAHQAGSEGATTRECEAVEGSEEIGELREVLENVIVMPKIVIERDSPDAREVDSSNDDDMDPLITVDDTESQSSDLINFDTVSYDVMRHQGGEEDDDERSITTLSSLSCDIKLDSPSKHSQGSNSSSLSNLLDSSLKETLGLGVNPSTHLTDCAESAASSCPSSPSLHSSKTMSSAVDESISEAFMNVMQISEDEARMGNCDIKVLSQKNVQSEDIQNVELEEPVSADRSVSSQSVDVSRGLNSDAQSIEAQHGDMATDLMLGQEVSSPVVEHMSLIKTSTTGCSPDESNILVPVFDGDHNNSESSHVPDNSEFNSIKDVKDLPDDDECLVNENVSFKLNEDKNEDISPLMPTSSETENSAIQDSTLINSGFQYPNDCLVGICEEKNSVSLPSCTPVSPGKKDIPEIRSNAVTSLCAFENNDIIVPAVPSTEDEARVLTCSDGAVNFPPLSSTTLKENPSCGALVVSSNLESLVNEAEAQVSSHMSLLIESISLEENNSSSKASSSSVENVSVDDSGKGANSDDSQNIEETSDSSQIVRTPSPADSALSVSNCVTSEDSVQRLSCDSSNETIELIPLEATNGDLPSTSERLRLSNARTENANDGVEVDADVKTFLPAENLESGKICKVESSLPHGASEGTVIHNDLKQHEDINLSPNSSFEKDIQDRTDSSGLHVETELRIPCLPIDNIESKSKRPSTLPQMYDQSPGMNFSEFLGLFNDSNVEGTSKLKQYDVASLDEAQQMASFLVDEILQKAMMKAEEKLKSSESLIGDRVEAVHVAQVLVDGVLSEASAHVSIVDTGKAEISTTCDIEDSGGDYSMNSSATEDLHSQVTDFPGLEACLFSSPKTLVQQKLPDSPKNILNISEGFLSTKTELNHEVVEGSEENLPPCKTKSAESAPIVISDKTSDNVINSEDSSLSESLVDLQSKESGRTSSTENVGADSSRSSLLTTSDLRLHSEASLFVDGVLQEAVKKYEESSSSDSSPVKIRSLALDSEFQEEEELATPCGEMLTEHFMDFESGRNVSVFCSIPENRNEDHLLAYDRVAHTIGNREVDSDTGKSVSVFRVEEDVFYEIQRASTCTSVFESVEEEDEDMIDTTIPVEERPQRTLSTSASFPSYDKDKFGTCDDPFSADCDAFEDAVGAFLTKERLAHNELRNREGKANSDSDAEQLSEVTCRALVLRHPEIGISNSDEKKRMAEKWANGGESEVPDTPEMREKQKAIREALDSDEDVAVKLCRLALTEGGLINDTLRREAWPRMLGLDPTVEVNAPSLEDLKSHPEYEQVVLDVNRSLKRFPPDIPKDQRETLQDKLTRLIMYVISKHPHLRYYQGYHDVAVTFLLVVGESIAFQIMERLSTEHLSDCMQPTMERTSYLLHFIYPLLHRLHPTLADYLERSEVGTMFCLPWFLTWFGHSLDHYKDVVRLYDHFLASPPLAPLYVAAVLVAHRADEVLAVDCDMAAIHALLSHIPDSLPLEILLRDATELYMKFPPESIEREVEERFRNEQNVRVQEMEARERVQRQRALRRRRGHSHGSGSWQLAEIQDRIGGSMMVINRWMPPWVVQQQRLSMRLLFASATFFVGFYVYSRGGDMLPYP